DLLESLPRWYAWGPPALTLTGASIAVAAIASVFLFRSPIVKAFFRFPFEAFLLSGTATAVVGLVAWRTWGRPGGNFPRLWAALLTLLCLAVFAWGVVE